MEGDQMSQCPGCGISYCLDCEEAVEPHVYRCEPCRIENELRDPFAITAREQAREIAELERWNKDLEAENIELKRMGGYCNRCSAAPGEDCGQDCTRDGSRDGNHEE
jgi:hypothetical protein